MCGSTFNVAIGGGESKKCYIMILDKALYSCCIWTLFDSDKPTFYSPPVNFPSSLESSPFSSLLNQVTLLLKWQPICSASSWKLSLTDPNWRDSPKDCLIYLALQYTYKHWGPMINREKEISGYILQIILSLLFWITNSLQISVLQNKVCFDCLCKGLDTRTIPNTWDDHKNR